MPGALEKVPAPPVVCGLNGSASSRRALGEALRLAAREGRRVRAVRAYHPAGYYWGAWASVPGGSLLPVPGRREVQAAEEATVRGIVDEVVSDGPVSGGRTPEVDVVVDVGRAVPVLLRHAKGAVALVVGQGDTNVSGRPYYTSVSGQCQRWAGCPVTVVAAPESPSADG